MNRYDSSYSAYYKAPDDDYPVGSAVDVTSEDKLDGTPYLAKFFNDVIGFMQAVFFSVNGKDAHVSNTPETARKSDVWDAIKKYVSSATDEEAKLWQAADDALGKRIDDEAGARQAADDALGKRIDGEAGARQAEDDALGTRIDGINAKIPAQASADNQLADKNFVNSSIATNTAYFIGTFDSLEKLNAYSGEKTNNDYAFVKTTDAEGNTLYNRYKWNGLQWQFEFSLNNSSFTQAQWDAVNSGATAAKINQIKNMVGAEATLNGSAGLVPAPAAGQQDYFLCGDGKWRIPSALSAQDIFDISHPVGDIYKQYPQQEEPHTLYNKNGVSSTWTLINYDGAFFRAQGTGAEPFIDKNGVLKVQGDSVGPHTINFEAGWVSFDSGYPDSYAFYNNRSSAGTKSADVKTSAEETRPKNYTIRVWKRTA